MWGPHLAERVVPDDALEAETFRLARRMAAISIEGLRTTKAAINKGAEIAGIRQAISYGIEQGAMLDSTETKQLMKFYEVREKEGLTAAIRWRESQFED